MTTTVVIIAVFIFGLFFFVVDYIFNIGIHQLLSSWVDCSSKCSPETRAEWQKN